MSDSAPEPKAPIEFPLADSATYRGWKDVPQVADPQAPVATMHPLATECVPLILIAAIFAAANFAVLPLTYVFRQDDWGAVWVYVSAGLITAQGGALPFALVFGGRRFLTRLLTCWLTAGLLFSIWCAGWLTYLAIYETRYRMADEVRFVALSLPLAALAIQLPLWLLKLYFGWSLVRPGMSERDAAARPLSISDYLLGMALVAVSITLARLAPERTAGDYWIMWSLFAASVAGTSLISVVPAMVLMLRGMSGRAGAAWLLLYSVAAAGVTLLVAGLVNPMVWRQLNSSRNRWELFGGLLVFLSFAAGLAGTMWAARALGYRLVMGRGAKYPIE